MRDFDFDDLDYREEEYFLYYEHANDNLEFELDMRQRVKDLEDL